MNKTIILLLALFMSALRAEAQDALPYAIYTSDGKAVTFRQMISRMRQAEVVCYGELHNNAMAHWLELQTLKALGSHREGWVLGLEMLEADNQLIVDEWQGGWITMDKMLRDLRLWPNHETDYQPLLEAAEAMRTPVLATNVPRRYASVVHYRGMNTLDSLSAEARSYLPPLPIPLMEDSAAAKVFEMMGGMGGSHGNAQGLQQAQALKDATMAWHIVQKLPGKVLHVHGNFHSDRRKGIPEYIERYRPGTRVLTVSSVTQEDISKPEADNLGVADFIICIPEDMAKSY